MLVAMPAKILPNSAPSSELLRQLGGRLALERRSHRMTAVDFASGLGISRATLAAAERGDPSVTMGTYVRILEKLGKVADLALVAGSVAEPRPGISKRRLALARQVQHGQRDPRSLFLLPQHVVARATLNFSEDAFGEPQPW
ncbi:MULTISPECIES: helix-turn-helix domain-containing protein [unclassified Variovorax]|uniref:helix-turn-helix domain-containing protein n=1 Tax=unclassified Variovorax TaxID=663243 RepID=UPI00211CAC8B|nr:helix-turn-helix domain-containing protein [Variovorax sp. YR752]